MDTQRKNGEFHESLVALQGILMLDTTTADLLKGGLFDRLISDIDTLKKCVEEGKEEVRSQQVLLTQAKNEVEKLRVEKEIIEKDLDSTKHNAETMTEKLVNELVFLHEKVAQATKDAKKAEDMVENIETKKMAAEGKAEEMQLKLSGKAQQLAETEREIVSLKTENATLTCSNQNLMMKIKAMEQKVSFQVGNIIR